jgi:hypothetical protein
MENARQSDQEKRAYLSVRMSSLRQLGSCPNEDGSTAMWQSVCGVFEALDALGKYLGGSFGFLGFRQQARSLDP